MKGNKNSNNDYVNDDNVDVTGDTKTSYVDDDGKRVPVSRKISMPFQKKKEKKKKPKWKKNKIKVVGFNEEKAAWLKRVDEGSIEDEDII